jgi:hypothetical protein
MLEDSPPFRIHTYNGTRSLAKYPAWSKWSSSNYILIWPLNPNLPTYSKSDLKTLQCGCDGSRDRIKNKLKISRGQTSLKARK